MTEASIHEYISAAFPDVEAVVSDENTFFFYDPDRMMPMATLVTNDSYDTVSDLDRPGVFRLNIGVGKETFDFLLGEQPSEDFPALDQWLPHPFYGSMFWVCVLNPSDGTFETAKSLLAESYVRAVRKYGKGRAGKTED